MKSVIFKTGKFLPVFLFKTIKLAEKMKKTAVVLLAIILVSCDSGNKTPDYVISHDDMVNIIIDIHVADGLLTDNNVRRKLAKKDSLNYYNAILNNYGYTRADFDTSVHFYSKNIDEYDKIYEEVLNNLSEMETKLKQESTEETKLKEENLKDKPVTSL